MQGLTNSVSAISVSERLQSRFYISKHGPCPALSQSLGATISELLSCLASLRAPPATLTLFLIPSCSALPSSPMFCLGNAVFPLPLVSVSYIGLIRGLSTPHNIYLAGAQQRESQYLHQTPVSREKKGDWRTALWIIEIKIFLLLPILSFFHSIFFPFFFLFRLNFKTFISLCSWVNELGADFPLKIKVEERRKEKKYVAWSVLVFSHL